MRITDLPKLSRSSVVMLGSGLWKLYEIETIMVVSPGVETLEKCFVSTWNQQPVGVVKNCYSFVLFTHTGSCFFIGNNGEMSDEMSSKSKSKTFISNFLKMVPVVFEEHRSKR